MSEYQFYDFLAVDRRLTPAQMAELRAISSRARITPTSFQNHYSFGDLKARPLDLVERYFDVVVYVANWGTRQLMLRVPRAAVDQQRAARYEWDYTLELHERGDHVIFDFQTNDEEGSDWIAESEAEAWLPALLPLREQLLRGDPRALYLAWLSALVGSAEEMDDDEPEPPVPAGLGGDDAALATLAEFLDIPGDFVRAAAAASPTLPGPPPAEELHAWLRALPAPAKDALLIAVADGGDADVRGRILSEFMRGRGSVLLSRDGARTAGQIRAVAAELEQARKRAERERQRREQERKAAEEAAARGRYLDGLAGREAALWQQVSELLTVAQPQRYDQAVALLNDLRDLSQRTGQHAEWARRVNQYRVQYGNRRTLMERFDRAKFA